MLRHYRNGLPGLLTTDYGLLALTLRYLHLAWLASGPKDALHDQLLPGRIGPGVLAVAQGTIKHSALAHFAGPDDVHVRLLVAFRRAFAEACQDVPVHVGEFVLVLLVDNGERLDAGRDRVLGVRDHDVQRVRARNMTGELSAQEPHPHLGVGKAERGAVQADEAAAVCEEYL